PGRGSRSRREEVLRRTGLSHPLPDPEGGNDFGCAGRPRPRGAALRVRAGPPTAGHPGTGPKPPDLQIRPHRRRRCGGDDLDAFGRQDPVVGVLLTRRRCARPRLHRTGADGGGHSVRRSADRDRRRQGETLRTRRALFRGGADPLPSSSPPHLPRRRAHPADSSDRPPRPCRNDRDRRPMNMTNDNSSRAETKEGTAEVVSVPAESVSPDTVEKYDRESRTRDVWSTKWSLPLTAFAVGLSLYQIYYALFGGPPTLVHRGIHVGAILVLCFAIQRFRLGETRRTPPWYDWLFMAGSIAI